MSSQLGFPPRGPLYEDLRGKVAIVTGGGKGIGKFIAARLAREGTKVTIAGRTPERLETAMAQIRAEGGQCEAVPTDISDPQQVDALFAAAREHFGPPDVLVNNAARMARTRDAAELTDEVWGEFVGTNVNGTMYCALRAMRAMADRGGAIINISTIGALRSHHGMVAYDITKAVMDSITRALGINLIRRGIRVNAVAPGRTFTRDGPYRLDRDDVRDMIPIGRAAHAEEIASVVAFLASEESSYVVGQTVVVDGGLGTQLSPPGQFV